MLQVVLPRVDPKNQENVVLAMLMVPQMRLDALHKKRTRENQREPEN